MSRSVVGNVETGTPPSKTFLEQLATVFPDRRDEIVAAEKRYRKTSVRKSRYKNQSAAQQSIISQIASNELPEARDALRYEIWTASDLDTHQRIWAIAYLSRVERLLGDLATSRGLFLFAIDLAKCLPDPEKELIALWEQQAIASYKDRRGDAHHILAKGLSSYPDAAILWYRKGVIHWDESDLSNAYAALTAALRHKGSRLDILCARGQLLVEWGLVEEAIVDLNEVLAKPQLVPIKAACARSALAYALFKREETDQANSEFAEAHKSVPGSPWPHYFIAMCFRDIYKNAIVKDDMNRQLGTMPSRRRTEQVTGWREAIRSELRRALECDKPSLSVSRREQITDMLHSLQKDSDLESELGYLPIDK